MIPYDHQSFLSKYALPNEHFNIDIAPLSYLDFPSTNDIAINKIVTHKDSTVRYHALVSPRLTSDHIHQILDSSPANDKIRVFSNPNINSSHISKGLDDTNPLVRAESISSYKAKPEHISKAIKDTNHNVRLAAVLYSRNERDVSCAKHDSHIDVKNAYFEKYYGDDQY